MGEAEEEGLRGVADAAGVLVADALGAGGVEGAEEIVGGVVDGPGAVSVGVGAVGWLRIRGGDGSLCHFRA